MISEARTISMKILHSDYILIVFPMLTVLAVVVGCGVYLDLQEMLQQVVQDVYVGFFLYSVSEMSSKSLTGSNV